jgi:ferredoxin
MSRRVVVDLDLCDAHGDCVLAAPEVFDLGEEDDTVRVLRPEPGDELWEKVERAVRACPVSAIRFDED